MLVEMLEIVLTPETLNPPKPGDPRLRPFQPMVNPRLLFAFMLQVA